MLCNQNGNDKEVEEDGEVPGAGTVAEVEDDVDNCSVAKNTSTFLFRANS